MKTDSKSSQSTMALRPYQLNAVKAVHKEWDSGNKNTLVVMPTGTGKTIVFSQIVKDQVTKCRKGSYSRTPRRASQQSSR